jgi:hypothetical protein
LSADFVEKVGSRILAGNQPEQVCARGARMAFMRQIDSVAGLSWNQIPAATLLRVDQSRCSDFFNEIRHEATFAVLGFAGEMWHIAMPVAEPSTASITDIRR